MITYILAIIILAIAITAMAVGVLLGGKPIKGSCGGMASLGMDTACDICGGDSQKCEEEQKKNTAKAAKNAIAYEAASGSAESVKANANAKEQ